MTDCEIYERTQQRLVSIGLTLRHAQHELGVGPAAAVRRTLDDAIAEVTVAIHELRELTRRML